MRKIHCEERIKEGFDNLPIKEIEDMCGWVEPDGNRWEVNTLFEGECMTCDTQQEAETIAKLEEIKGLLLKK